MDYPCTSRLHVTARSAREALDAGTQDSWGTDLHTAVPVLNFCVSQQCAGIALVDEQIRGAIVQGIGGALFEECLYDDAGLMKNGSMADYLVPMAAEMPDIVVAHNDTPTKSSMLGANGAGKAGTADAPGAMVNAINNALRPLGCEVWSQPGTPEKILRALEHI